VISTQELHSKLQDLLTELGKNLAQVSQDNLADNGARSQLVTQAWDTVKDKLVTLDQIDRGLSASIRLAAIEVWRYNNFLEMPSDVRASLLGAPTYHSLRVKIALTHARDDLACFMDGCGHT